ncbi:MAG: sigma 54-interacting transcriptional regulator [Ignavibacteriales bacterium]|nr:sigma 54-interacting transcriptional regulator [Ignavibacteriales bacterium]
MKKIQKILERQNYIILLAIIAGLLLAFLFEGPVKNLDQSVSFFYGMLGGEKEPDSSVVIISIDADDIEKLGGWPLKRTYYALLVNELTNLEAKKIGIEILLSSNVALQSVYSDLLNEEIGKSNKVVVSSLITDENKYGEKFDKDSLIYSQPKIDLPHIPSGHLNYFSSGGLFVPSSIYVNGKREKSFSLALAGDNFSNIETLMKINLYCPWKKITHYSLIEFFKAVGSDEPSLKNLKDKIVLVGVTDPTIAKTLHSNYDDELPGVGFHALALDNILTGRLITNQFSSFINAAAIILLILFAQFTKRNRAVILLSLGVIYFGITFFLFNFVYIEVSYSFFILPLFFVLSAETAFYFLRTKIKLDETYSETEVLRSALSYKEEQLTKLQKEIEHGNGLETETLIQKIKLLQDEITKLKEYDEADNSVLQTADNSAKIFNGIVYCSKEIDNIINLIKKISSTNATALISGESGSGKELIARAIHDLSERKKQNFVALNCAALPETLLESELFGHVRGAFTNAIGDKKGLFELADGGTIFLDEVGETTELFQAKLLRVIQFGEFQKVGSPETKHVDVRIIAATNRDIEQLVKQKKFREDLYYRLNVLRIGLPPLRERKDDIEVLANYFVKRESPSLQISRAVMQSLLNNQWNGNVRELESIIKRAAIFAASENRNVIKLGDLPDDYRKYEKLSLENLILDSLRSKKFSHSSINETAKELGDISRTMVTENFRGIFFREYVKSDYDLEKSITEVAGSAEAESLEKIRSKASTYLENIRKDLVKIEKRDFETVKNSFPAKYKNLPSRYHQYLDLIIKRMIEKA